MTRESGLAAVFGQGAQRSMTPPPGDGNPFSSSQDAGANPIDAALDKAARIAETLLKNIGPAEGKSGPPHAPVPPAAAPTPTPAPPAEPASTPPPAPEQPPPPADAAPVEAPAPDEVAGEEGPEPVADIPVQATDAPVEQVAEPPAEPVTPTEPAEPPSVVVPTTDDITALLGDAPIEDQLERIEGLLDEAQAQIGGETPARDRPAAAPADALPDASIGEPDLAIPDGLPAEADIRFDDEEVPEGREDAQAPKARSRWLDPDTASGQFVILLQDILCGLLDRVDRPFVRVPYAVRQILGVCAAITLLASVITLVLACL